jgi:hypothetical protein
LSTAYISEVMFNVGARSITQFWEFSRHQKRASA